METAAKPEYNPLAIVICRCPRCLICDRNRTRSEKEFPGAVACFEEDFEACIAHLRLPIAHRKSARTTNLLERLFGEDRRCTKVIPHAFGEKPVLKLMFAAPTRASQSWRRLVIGEFELKQLAELREQWNEEFVKRTSTQTQPASRQQFSSRKGT
jgi:transposase-like protein